MNVSDGGEQGEDSGYSPTRLGEGHYSFGANYGLDQGLNSGLDSYGSLSSFDKVVSKLEGSISASAASPKSNLAGCETDYAGITGSAVTPLGGAEFGAGFYSDCNGMVGGYLSGGYPVGNTSVFIGLAKGHTSSLSGTSLTQSVGISAEEIPIGAAISASMDATTGVVTGHQESVGLSLGNSVVSVSTSVSSTTTTEFTSLYLVYLQFLNWVGYPSAYDAAYPYY